ncbi:hypothetical protein DL771_001139 [Monosporascus sp. 5C6A]|nr:hypothetical protein DL771_001139 [Monosporascus sp. 5C6A]
MDPLSTTGSIIAVLQLSSKVAKYVSTAAGATKERKRVREEIRAREQILQQLEDEADDSDEGKAWSDTIKTLEAPGAPLGRLAVALTALKIKLEPKKGLDKAFAKLKWPFDEKEVEKIIAAIDREKSLLGLALANDSRKLIHDIKRSAKENGQQLTELIEAIKQTSKDNQDGLADLKDGLASVQGSQARLQDGLDRLQNHQEAREDANERKAILDWLTPIDFASQQSDFINRRQAGTGQWLLDSAEFQTWLRTDKQTLFCPGIPGSGKTILTSIVIEYLYNEFRKGEIQSDGNIGIAYLYCTFRQQDEQKAEDFLSSLLKQLAQGLSSLADSVKSLHNKHEVKRTRPTLDEISKALQSVAALYSRVFIIIDALDEYQAINGGRARFLSEVFNLQANCGANIFATSRFIPEIQERFLLAQLHLGSLAGKRSPTAIRKALTKLSTGSEAYDTAYREAMERIEGQLKDQGELAKQVLSWITCAKRPLTTTELQHALAVEEGNTELDEGNIPQIEDVVSVCAGLVTIDKESDIIRDAKGNYNRTPLSWAAENGHESVVKLLLAAGVKADSKDKWVRTPLSYAAESGHESIVKLLLAAGVEADSKDDWVRTPLSYAAENGYESIVKLLLAAGVEGDLEDNWGRTPLSYAAENGYESIVKLLLAAGVKADLKDKRDRTPLLYAARFGHKAVVKLLLAEGVEADSKGLYDGFRTPLLWAAKNGYKSIVKLLLAAGVKADLKDDCNWTPISYAAENGYESIVKLLLAAGVKADSKDTNFNRTPLSLAAAKGHESVVKLLLAAGIEADSKDSEFWQTPLS